MVSNVHRAAKQVPNYPGRKRLEAALSPVVAPLSLRHAGRTIQRLLGFWALWQTYGGLEGLITAGLISRAGVYNQRNEFRDMFGVDVEDWQPAIGADLFAGGIAEQISGGAVAKHRTAKQLEIR